MSVGPVLSGGNGPTALTHMELNAWAYNTGIEFEGSEANWLIDMSSAYLSEFNKSDNANTISPLHR